jgi:hypothetical protein
VTLTNLSPNFICWITSLKIFDTQTFLSADWTSCKIITFLAHPLVFLTCEFEIFLHSQSRKNELNGNSVKCYILTIIHGNLSLQLMSYRHQGTYTSMFLLTLCYVI